MKCEHTAGGRSLERLVRLFGFKHLTPSYLKVRRYAVSRDRKISDLRRSPE